MAYNIAHQRQKKRSKGPQVIYFINKAHLVASQYWWESSSVVKL